MTKKYHIAAVLLTAALLMIGMSAVCTAESYKFSGECGYNGSEIKSDFTSDEFAASQSELEPGDELSYTITYANNSKDETSWYMRNTVLETLEEAKEQAENGGYTYVLKNIGPDGKETVLFDNSEVGGETKTEDLEGLKQATNATGNYFFIQKLKPGEEGTTSLYVALDGETEVNDYMDTHGALLVSYAVENNETNTETEQPTPSVQPPRSSGGGTPRTGDSMELMKFILLMAGALIAAFLAIFSWRRDRRKQAAAAAAGVDGPADGPARQTAGGAAGVAQAAAGERAGASPAGGSGKDGGSDA